MQTIMIVLLEESEDIQEDLLLAILSVLGRNKSVSISNLYLLTKMVVLLLCCGLYIIFLCVKVFVVLL